MPAKLLFVSQHRSVLEGEQPPGPAHILAQWGWKHSTHASTSASCFSLKLNSELNTKNANSHAVEQVPANTAGIPGIHWMGGKRLRKASNTNKLFSIYRSRNTETGKQNTQVKVHTSLSLFDHEPHHTDQATSHLLFATSLLETVKDLWLFKARDSTDCFLTMLANCHMLHSMRGHWQPPLSSWLLCYPETTAHREFYHTVWKCCCCAQRTQPVMWSTCCRADAATFIW